MNIYLEFDYDDTCLSIEEDPETPIIIEEDDCNELNVVVLEE